MYLSHSLGDGKWSAPVNLGEKINTRDADSPYSFSPDGKYFFFGRNNKADSIDNLDIFWVDSKIVYQLIEKNKQ